MRRGLIGLVVLAACDGTNATSDAAPPDAAPLDAFTCSLTPSPTVAGTEDAAASFLLLLETDWSPVAVYEDGGALVVFTPRRVFHVSLAGELLSTSSFGEPDASNPLLAAIARGPAGFGAILETRTAGERSYQLCILDETGAFDPSRCTAVAGDDPGQLAFDGTAYRRYVAVDGRIEREVYDDTGVLVDTVDLTASDAITTSVLAAAVSPFAEHLVTLDDTGGACPRQREHVITGDGDHEVRELLADDAGTGEPPRFAVDAAGDVSLLSYGSCLVDGCQEALERYGTVTTYVGGARVLDRVPAPVGAGGVPLRDGDRTVLLGTHVAWFNDGKGPVGLNHGKLARIAADGDVDQGPLELDGSSADSFIVDFAAATLARGDYAIAFSVQDAVFLTRVLVP